MGNPTGTKWKLCGAYGNGVGRVQARSGSTTSGGMHGRESPKQLISETRIPISVSPGKPARHDYEYKRCGVCNIFLACEPLAGKRLVKITETKTKQDWAFFLEDIASQYQGAEKITLVMDNLNTHTPGSFYETSPPDHAKALWDRFLG